MHINTQIIFEEFGFEMKKEEKKQRLGNSNPNMKQNK